MGFIRGDMRVMIVEDHLLYTEVIRKIVGEMGHAVVAEAATVSKALACLAVALPELVIVDMELPDGTGFDLMRRDVDPKPRFLVVSAHCDSLTAHLVSHFGSSGIRGQRQLLGAYHKGGNRGRRRRAEIFLPSFHGGISGCAHSKMVVRRKAFSTGALCPSHARAGVRRR